MVDLFDTYEGLIYAELHGEEVTATRRLTHSGAKRTESEYRRQSWSTGQIPRERPATESTAPNLSDVSLESIQRAIEGLRASIPQDWVVQEDHLTLHPQQWADLMAAAEARPQSAWRGPTDAATVDTSLLRASTAFPARSPSLRDHPGEAPHRVKRK